MQNYQGRRYEHKKSKWQKSFIVYFKNLKKMSNSFEGFSKIIKILNIFLQVISSFDQHLRWNKNVKVHWEIPKAFEYSC